jgi:3-hydroxy acid dehydrogenase / malonic semialdehyde reductase
MNSGHAQMDSTASWLPGSHVLITGGSSGIGRALAFRLAGVCRRITLVARDQEDAFPWIEEEIKRKSQGLTAVKTISLDIRNTETAQRVINEEYEVGEQIDALVNCAGGCHKFGLLEQLSFSDIDEIMDVNAKAPIYWLRLLLPRMKNNTLRGRGLKRAHIILMSSRSGERGLPNLAVYAAAKASLERLLESVRTEYAFSRIAFTIVNPGAVDTGFTRQWLPSQKASHSLESMNVSETAEPIFQALAAEFVVNRISFQSLGQWIKEPGVLSFPKTDEL